MTVALGALILGGAVCAIYCQAIHAPFIFDDTVTVQANPSIEKLWPLVDPSGAASPLNPPAGFPTSARPLVNLSLAINYHFGQLDPVGYHAVHMAIHLITALLLWAITWRTLRLDYFQGRFDSVAGGLSFASALVWAVHPLNTEAIQYVTQRTELMMGLFYLATLYACIRYWAATRSAERALWLSLATLACVLGMACKEMMVSAPVMALLYERTFIAPSLGRALRQSWPLYLGLAIGWLPLLAINYYGRTPLAGFGMGVPAHVWWFTQAHVLFIYLKLAVWPWPLLIHYGTPYLKTVADAWPWLLSAGLLGIATLVLLWRRSAVGFVAAWVLIVLSPTLVVPLIKETGAERRMYVPLAALAALALPAGFELIRRAGDFIARRATPAPTGRLPMAVFTVATAVLVAVFSLISMDRLAVYRDELTLWQDAVIYQPDDPMTQVNLGTRLAEVGRREEAMEHFEHAIQINSDDYPDNFFRAHYNLARALEASGRPQEAIEHYEEALRLRPNLPAAHNNLGLLLANTGRTAAAIDHYRLALDIDPDFAVAHSNLGIALAKAGLLEEALGHFEAALRLKHDVEAYANLASAYALVGRRDDAIAMAHKAVELARSRGDSALAAQIETWLTSYQDVPEQPR